MEGYAKVAQLMSTHPEFAILRRFSSLNMQNILYLQAEITHLEAELRRLQSEDARHGNRQNHPYDWWSLAHGQGEGDMKQWEAVLKIREKLEKFNDAILKQGEISHLYGPTDHNLQFFRSWYERPTMGAFPLLGLDRHTWGPEFEQDLIALGHRKPQDPFSQWFTRKCLPVYHRFVGEKLKCPVSEDLGTGLYEYDDKTLRIICRIVSTVTASILPLCSIIILYLVKANEIRLCIIVILSACFSFALAVMTNAKKIEIFAATSAFAAVNVVYLTNDVSCQTSA